MKEEFINIPVHKSLVWKVYKVLGESSSPEDQGKAVSREDAWSKNLLAKAYRESGKNMKAVFDYLSERPGKIVTSEDIYSSMGLTGAQLAGVFGAFGRRVKNRYGLSTGPFEASRSAVTGATYTMSEEVAQQLSELRMSRMSGR